MDDQTRAGSPARTREAHTPATIRQVASLAGVSTATVSRVLARSGRVSPDLEEHTAQIQKFVDMGFDEVYLHNVGRDQSAFIRTFGEKVLPNLKLS